MIYLIDRENRDMSIKEVAKSRWRIVVTVKIGGKVYKREETFEGAYSRARTREAELKRELRESITKRERESADKLTVFSGLIESYGSFKEWPSGMLSYAIRLKDDCGAYPIGNIDDLQARFLRFFAGLDNDVTRFKGKRPNVKLSNGTKNRILAIARMICTYGVKSGALPYSPVALVRQWSERPRNRILSVDELSAIRGAITEICPWLSAAFEFSIRIPIRLGDLVALTLANYDRFNCVIRLRAHKTDAAQVAPIPPELDNYFMSLPDGAEYLFARDTVHKKPLGYIKHFWGAVLDKAKVTGLRWHDLRHHACTVLHELGAASYEIQTAGGWKSRVMVELYHSLQADKAASGIRERMQNRLSGKIEKLEQRAG